MLIVLLFAAVAAAVWFPQTVVGGALRRLLIEWPARILNGLKRGHIVTAVMVFGVLWLAFTFGKNEGLYAALQGVGEGVSYLLAFDLVSYIDVLAIGFLIAATVRFREAIGIAAARARQWAHGVRAARAARGRTRRIRSAASRPRSGEDSDDPAPGFAWA